MWLDDVVIIDHDGLHGSSTKTSGFRSLSSGPHPITVRYFEYTGGQALTVRYRGPDTNNSWRNIPNSALKSGASPPTVAASIEEAPIVIAERNAPEDFVSLNVYPNPVSSGDLTIQVSSELTEPVDVNLIDIMGKSYYRNVFGPGELQSGARIAPATTLINGMYVVVVKQGKYTVKEKVIIKN